MGFLLQNYEKSFHCAHMCIIIAEKYYVYILGCFQNFAIQV